MYSRLLAIYLLFTAAAYAVDFGDAANDGGGGFNAQFSSDGDNYQVQFTLKWPITATKPSVVVGGGHLVSGPTYGSQTTAGGMNQCLCLFDVDTNVGTINIGGTQVAHISGFGLVADVAVAIQSVAPTVVAAPQAVTVNVGQAVTFTVQAKGSRPITVKWYDFGTSGSGSGTVLETHTISSGAETDVGTDTFQYTTAAIAGSNGHEIGVQLVNDAGQDASSLALLTVNNPGPTITLQPQSKSVTAGDSFVLQSAASLIQGQTPALSCQWYKDGSPIAGATNATYIVPTATTASAGAYYILWLGGGGTTQSQTVQVTVAASKGTFTGQPQGGSVQDGQSKSLSVSVQAPPGYTGAAPTFQWYKDGQLIAGATGQTYTIPAMAIGDAGVYFCVAVWGDYDSETSETATLAYQSSGSGGGGGSPGQPAAEGFHTVTCKLVNQACPYPIYLAVLAPYAGSSEIDGSANGEYVLGSGPFTPVGGTTISPMLTNTHYAEAFPLGLYGGALDGWVNRFSYSTLTHTGLGGGWAHIKLVNNGGKEQYANQWDITYQGYSWYTSGVVVRIRRSSGEDVTDGQGIAWEVTSDGAGNWQVVCTVNIGGQGSSGTGQNTDPSGDTAYQDFKKALDDAGGEDSGVTSPSSTDAAADYTTTFDDRGKIDDIHGQLATARQAMDGAITGIQTKLVQATDTSWIPTQWGSQSTWSLGTVNMGGRQLNLGFDVTPFGQTLSAVRAMLLFAESVAFTVLIVVTVRAYL